MQIQVCIPTFDRPEELRRLLLDLEREGAQRVHVYDDHSSEDYSRVITMIHRLGWTWQRSQVHHGREGYTKLVECIWGDLSIVPLADLYVFLQDDVRLCSSFFERLIDAWQGIDDLSKATMMLLTDTRDMIWVSKISPEPRGSVDQIDWVDQIYMTSVRTLLDFSFKAPLLEYRRPPGYSSGAGLALTVALRDARRTMYRANPSLVAHVSIPSKMHGDARIEHPLHAINFIDGEQRHALLLRNETITASIASIPEREQDLAHVVDSILPQVDELRVWLNGYTHTPEFLRRPCVRVFRGADLGDVGKFYDCEHATGYRFTIDDDIVYPSDYVVAMIDWIERFERRAIVGVYGSIVRDRDAGYYRGRQRFHFERGLKAPTQAHILGTGTTAYHASTIKLRQADFETRNAADLWLARVAQQQHVPFVIVPRVERWLIGLPSGLKGIYTQHDPTADRLVRETAWMLPEGLHGV